MTRIRSEAPPASVIVIVGPLRPADVPVYPRDGTEPRLYVRSGNATTPLALDDAVHYVGSRWPGRTTGHVLEAFLGRHR